MVSDAKAKEKNAFEKHDLFSVFTSRKSTDIEDGSSQNLYFLSVKWERQKYSPSLHLVNKSSKVPC